MEVVGINGVGDCIGIIAWSPNATLIYHMNEVDDYRLSSALLIFARDAKILNSPGLSSAIAYMCSQEGYNDNCENKLKFDSIVSPLLNELSTTNAFAHIPFQLITSNPRSMTSLLSFLEKAGIKDSQTSIDINESQIFIERKTGQISIECPSHTKEAAKLEKEQPPLPLSDTQKIDKAVREGEIQGVLELIKTGYDIHSTDNPEGLTTFAFDRNTVIRSPILEATQLGHIEMVSGLLTAGIHYEVQISPFGKNTSLTTAIKYGHEDIAHLFLDLTPPPSKKWLSRKNNDGLDALQLAKNNGWSSVCDKINHILVSSPIKEKQFNVDVLKEPLALMPASVTNIAFDQPRLMPRDVINEQVTSYSFLLKCFARTGMVSGAVMVAVGMLYLQPVLVGAGIGLIAVVAVTACLSACGLFAPKNPNKPLKPEIVPSLQPELAA